MTNESYFPFSGNSRWVAVMEWSGQEAYNKAPWVNFTVDGELAGNFTGTDRLGFLKVGTAVLRRSFQS